MDGDEQAAQSSKDDPLDSGVSGEVVPEEIVSEEAPPSDPTPPIVEAIVEPATEPLSAPELIPAEIPAVETPAIEAIPAPEAVEISGKDEVVSAEIPEASASVEEITEVNQTSKVETATNNRLGKPVTDLPLTSETLPLEPPQLAQRDPTEIAKTLDQDVLEAAFRLVARKNFEKGTEASRLARKNRVSKLHNRIKSAVQSHSKGAKLSVISKECSTTLKVTSNHVNEMVKNGEIRAEGNSVNRRFFIVH